MVISPSAMTALLAAICLNPTNDVATERVDLIEVNHFYDEQGRLVFDQIIFYDWSALESRYHVRAWRLLKTPAQMPRKSWEERGFVAILHDGEVLRKVKASSMRESWTQYDPELAEREYLPKEQRRELRKIIIPAKASR